MQCPAGCGHCFRASSPEGRGLLQVAGVLLSGPRRLPLIDIPTAPGLESRTALRDPPHVRTRPSSSSSSAASSSSRTTSSASNPLSSSLSSNSLFLHYSPPLPRHPVFLSSGSAPLTAGPVRCSLLFVCVAWVCVPSLCPVIVCKSYSRSLPSWSRDRLDEGGPV